MVPQSMDVWLFVQAESEYTPTFTVDGGVGDGEDEGACDEDDEGRGGR